VQNKLHVIDSISGRLTNGGPRTQWGFAGAVGYSTEPTGMMHMGARFYIPTLGRFLIRNYTG